MENCTERIPFNYLGTDSYAPYKLNACASASPDTYFGDLSRWLARLFARNEYSAYEQVFTIAVYYANKANLHRAATVPDYYRTVVRDPGTMIQKPTVERWTVVFLSVIIALHLVGLTSLAVYTAYHPTWTETFDSMAVLRLGVWLMMNGVGAVSGVSEDGSRSE